MNDKETKQPSPPSSPRPDPKGQSVSLPIPPTASSSAFKRPQYDTIEKAEPPDSDLIGPWIPVRPDDSKGD